MANVLYIEHTREGGGVFKAPVGDTLVSMCELNALGGRDRYYDELQAADRISYRRAPVSPPSGG